MTREQVDEWLDGNQVCGYCKLYLIESSTPTKPIQPVGRTGQCALCQFTLADAYDN